MFGILDVKIHLQCAGIKNKKKSKILLNDFWKYTENHAEEKIKKIILNYNIF